MVEDLVNSLKFKDFNKIKNSVNKTIREMILFIPIKKDSQRVPGKNFRVFQGYQLYKHTLLKFKEYIIYVDTDSKDLIKEIKNDPELRHVRPFMRNNKLIGHKVSVIDLIKSFIEEFKIPENEDICQLHVTTPLLGSDTLFLAHMDMIEGGYDSTVSCNKIQSRLWKKEKYGYCPINHNPIKLEQTQDLPDVFEENSAFYIFKTSVVKKYNNRIGINPNFYPIKFPENLDIDTEDNWKTLINICENELN